jgi:hypothetical protein
MSDPRPSSSALVFGGQCEVILLPKRSVQIQSLICLKHIAGEAGNFSSWENDPKDILLANLPPARSFTWAIGSIQMSNKNIRK